MILFFTSPCFTDKLICNKVGANRYLTKFNPETKQKEVTSDKIVLGIFENGLKLDLTDTSKPNSKFTFPASYEEELIVKN